MIIIKAYSRRYLHVEHNGRTARFYGQLDSVRFRAYDLSMQWIRPDGTKKSPTYKERLEVMEAVIANTMGTNNHVTFYGTSMDEVQLDVSVPPGRRAKRKSIWRRLFG
ncbi:MAG: hypothetical protein LBD25_02005 [Coriobacteriales bacterium]|jgi:hypothetical protein|nr:hypothetical protein [Coriobacteriales bacterium]